MNIKILKGTIVKVAGHSVQLKTSLYLEEENIDSFLEKHEVLEADYGHVKKPSVSGVHDESSNSKLRNR